MITISLTTNEALWIVDKCVKECVRGQAAVNGLADEKDPDIQAAVQTAREVLVAIATLGQKVTKALDAELNKEEAKEKE